jgi:hypothetical protein
MTSSSPLLTGGAGFDFEDSVAAIYLTALLLEGGVLGLGQYTASQVALQRASSGSPLDDVIVSGVDVRGDSGTLHLQVKSTLHIGEGPSNTDFRDVLKKAWATIWGTGFTHGRDRVGGAVGSISLARLKALRRLQEVAFQSATADDFWLRFDAVTNKETQTIRNAFAAVLREIDPAGVNNERLWRFFQHFVVLQFDIQDSDSKDIYYAIEHLKSALQPDGADQAANLWRKLISVAKGVGDAGGSIARAGLLERLIPEFRLEPARSARKDLQRLSVLAQSTLSDIRLDISGHRIHRTAVIDKLSDALTHSRFVQITGEPGTGKSAVLRTIAESEAQNGFIFVLSEKRIEGNGWVGFSTANGLGCPSAATLLAEIAASSTPTLFIDGIDRIVAKPAQQVVADILRAIATVPACGNWRVIASVRDENIEHIRTWIPSEFLSKTGVISISVGPFDDDEAKQIAQVIPALAPLLSAIGPVSEIARRPFFLRVLAEGIERANGVAGEAPRSEIELIEAWWARGGYDATRADARLRQQVLRNAAETGVTSFGRHIDVQGLNAEALQDLVDDNVLHDVEPGFATGFAHDVFFEWSLFKVARARGSSWLDLVRAAGEPPFFGRIVGLLSQWAFERDENWRTGLEELEAANARSQWRRAWLIAPFSSPLFILYQTRVDAAFDQNPQRMRRLLLGIQAEKTQPNPMVLGGFAGRDLDRLARLRLADQLSWPSDYLTWGRFLIWLLPQCASIAPALVADAISVFQSWITAFAQQPTLIPTAMKTATLGWLKAVEHHRRPDDIREILQRDHQTGWGAISDDELQELEQSLRFQFFAATKSDPDLQREYFGHLSLLGRQMRESCAFIVTHMPLLAATAMSSVVDLCLAVMIDDLPEDGDRRSGRFSGGSSIFDWDKLSLEEGGAEFFPASPAREPFRTLFQQAPDEALRLTRALCNHAMEAWRQLNRRELRFGMTPLPFIIQFPWGEQKFWGNTRVYGYYRGINGPHLLESALMALEMWAFSELERGRDADEVIRAVLSENECCAVLGIALGIALQASAVTDVSLALVSSSHLWRWDTLRGRADLMHSNQNESGFKNDASSRALHEALAKTNRLPVRQQDIQTLAMMFVIGQSPEMQKAAKATIARLPDALPFECEEEAGAADAVAYLAKEAKKWVLLADPSHYRLYKTEEPGKIGVGFENPESSQPETIARVESARESLSWFTLAQWVQTALDSESLPQNATLADAISQVRRENADALLSVESEDPVIQAKQAAVVGVAAIVIKHFGTDTAEEIEWAKTLLQKGAARPLGLDGRTSPSSFIVYHPALSAAKGLSFLVLRGIDERWAKKTLLALMLHPLEAIYEVVIDSCLACWLKDPRFGWVALCLSLELANEGSARDEWRNREVGSSRRSADREEKLDRALAALDNEAGTWMEAPSPAPSANVSGEAGDEWGDIRSQNRIDQIREEFRYDLASRAIKHFPLDLMVKSTEVVAPLLRLADRLLVWTVAAHPPERIEGRRVERSTPPYQWTGTFMSWLSYLCSVLPPDIASARYITKILAIADDNACFEVLEPFVDALVCRQIHDDETLSAGVLENLGAIADRVSMADWRWDARRVNANLTRQKHGILKALYLVNVERADGARRFANRDWSDIPVVIPALARLFQATVGVTAALGYFLQLAERSIDHYPAEALADTITRFLLAHVEKPAALRSISAPERMAALVQTLAAREHPLSESLRGKLLKILDLLVELGDRRSAALLGSEWFKTVRRVTTVPSQP